MPKSKTEEPKIPQCFGGRSFGCNRVPHDQGQKISCWRCHVYQGCSFCCDKERDLVCLICNDWAARAALMTHGPMVKDPELSAECWKIIHMAERGQIADADVGKLYGDIFRDTKKLSASFGADS